MGTRAKSSESEVSYKKTHKNKKKLRRKQKKDLKKLSEGTKRVKRHSESSVESYEAKRKRLRRSRSWSSQSSSSFSKDLDHRSHSPRIYEKKNGTSAYNSGLNGRNFRNQKSRNGRNFGSSNNMFYQKFQENYRRQIAGEKTNQLYQSAFPIKHIPEKLNFSYRLLGRNIFNKSSYSGNVSDGSVNGSTGGPMKRRRKIEKRFKNYMRFQAQQGNLRDLSALNSDKAHDNLARRLQTKSLSLKDDYESDERRKSSSQSSTKSSSSTKLDSSSDDSSSRESSDRSLKKKKHKKKKRKRQNSSSIESESDSEFEVAEKSTESKNGIRKTRHKKKVETTKSDSEASLLDLRDKLQPIGAYIKDRETMLDEMFRCIKGEKLQAMLPDILKTRSFEEVKARCLDQLECMSKKRILCILDGKEMTSSSGTEDSSADEASAEEKFLPTVCDEQPVTEPSQSNKEASPSSNKRMNPVKTVELKPESTKDLSEPVKIPNHSNNVISAQCVHADEDFADYYEGFKTINKKFANIRPQVDNNSSEAVFDGPKGIPSLRPKMDIRPIMSFTQLNRLNKNEIIDIDDDESNDEVLTTDNVASASSFTTTNMNKSHRSPEGDKQIDTDRGINPCSSLPNEVIAEESVADVAKDVAMSPNEKSKRKRHCSICSESYSECPSCVSYNSFCSLCAGRRSTSSSSLNLTSDSFDSEESDDLDEVLTVNDDEELLLIEAEIETLNKSKVITSPKKNGKISEDELETNSVESEEVTTSVSTSEIDNLNHCGNDCSPDFFTKFCQFLCLQTEEQDEKVLEQNADCFMQDLCDEFLNLQASINVQDKIFENDNSSQFDFCTNTFSMHSSNIFTNAPVVPVSLKRTSRKRLETIRFELQTRLREKTKVEHGLVGL